MNPRLAVYETATLPLSYSGILFLCSSGVRPSQVCDKAEPASRIRTETVQFSLPFRPTELRWQQNYFTLKVALLQRFAEGEKGQGDKDDKQSARRQEGVTDIRTAPTANHQRSDPFNNIRDRIKVSHSGEGGR